MFVSVKNPELLTITSKIENTAYFGGNQEWYEKNWNKQAGCGATCASNISAYLAASGKDLKNLYPYAAMEKADFTKQMEDMILYVTPGAMGVNHVKKFTDGFDRFLKERNASLTAKVLVTDKVPKPERKLSELMDFVREGLLSDCPLAFLNLSKGEEKRIQGWHWITITEAEITDDRVKAVASDEGKKIEFDLGLWFLTTRKHGGLIYYS
ncbi:hypothetical protein [Anaerocolumna xylanovorans]|uniref:Peptidase_C39 like family protein n=1 Tax=Anaerocolumna xylanovorans DSM 12503 TaxID=1121345 RepID=A0A1M7XZT1_9FIRM|nr:hypothetical protein [Anaerocolumna xylanovorans]SHO44784.1 hypothetical protein SAMN02745217_00722 [Anaerocolumna xylanovorans DSM 12503]